MFSTKDLPLISYTVEAADCPPPLLEPISTESIKPRPPRSMYWLGTFRATSVAKGRTRLEVVQKWAKDDLSKEYLERILRQLASSQPSRRSKPVANARSL